jgi:hypothetical protein
LVITQNRIKMHGQQNIKYTALTFRVCNFVTCLEYCNNVRGGSHLRPVLYVFCFIRSLSFLHHPIQMSFFLQSVVLNSSKISSLNCTSFRSTSSFIPSTSFFLRYHLHHFIYPSYSRSTNTIVWYFPASKYKKPEVAMRFASSQKLYSILRTVRPARA